MKIQLIQKKQNNNPEYYRRSFKEERWQRWEEQEQKREAHLARVLKMEQEIAFLRSKQRSAEMAEVEQTHHHPPCYQQYNLKEQDFHSPDVPTFRSPPTQGYQQYSLQEREFHSPGAPTVQSPPIQGICSVHPPTTSNSYSRHQQISIHCEGDGGKQPILQVFLPSQS